MGGACKRHEKDKNWTVHATCVILKPQIWSSVLSTYIGVHVSPGIVISNIHLHLCSVVTCFFTMAGEYCKVHTCS